MIKLFIPILILMMCLSLYCLEFSRSAVDFSITDENKKSLRFDKDQQVDIYNYLKYSDLNYSTEKVRELKDEIKVIEFLWNSAKDSVKLDLKSASVGYPVQYRDILLKQIEVFSNDPKWQKYIIYRKKNKVPSWDMDHDLIESIMLEGNVYGTLGELLEGFGYKIKGFSVEKIGFVTQKNIDKYGLKYKEKDIKHIPIPFIVWVLVEKVTQENQK